MSQVFQKLFGSFFSSNSLSSTIYFSRFYNAPIFNSPQGEMTHYFSLFGVKLILVTLIMGRATKLAVRGFRKPCTSAPIRFIGAHHGVSSIGLSIRLIRNQTPLGVKNDFKVGIPFFIKWFQKGITQNHRSHSAEKIGGFIYKAISEKVGYLETNRSISCHFNIVSSITTFA